MCRTISVPTAKPGKKTIDPRTAAFTAGMKVYSTISARRCMVELDEAFERGFIDKVPHFNIVLNFFDRDDAADILQSFIKQSTAPLEAVETKFAIDSSGFAGARYVRWFDEKYGAERSEIHWVKLHAVTGVNTNVITSCEVLEKHSADSPQLPGLIVDTAQTFKIREVSGDKAFTSLVNCMADEGEGGQFYPQFKRNATGAIGGAYKRTYHLFAMNAEEYGQHYHLRSNVESTFSAVKRKFGVEVRAKSGIGYAERSSS